MSQYCTARMNCAEVFVIVMMNVVTVTHFMIFIFYFCYMYVVTLFSIIWIFHSVVVFCTNEEALSGVFLQYVTYGCVCVRTMFSLLSLFYFCIEIEIEQLWWTGDVIIALMTWNGMVNTIQGRALYPRHQPLYSTAGLWAQMMKNLRYGIMVNVFILTTYYLLSGPVMRSQWWAEQK